MNKYLQKQNSFQKKANEILKELDLLNFLGKLGKTDIVGSLALNLMTWPDIDIVVSSNLSEKDFLLIPNYLFPKQNIYSINLQDFRKSIFPDRPQGMYCGATYLEKPDIFWKIDIWDIYNSKAMEFVNWVKSKLTDENRLTILKIKTDLKEKTKYGKTISGMEVYKAVLEHGVNNLEEFRKYYITKRR